MTVAFISGDFLVGPDNILRPGGCGYYRCILPMLVCGQPAHAGREAWDPIRGFGIRDTSESGVFGFTNIMLKLIMLRWTPKQIELAQSLGQRIVVDVDDFYRGLTPANKAYEETHSSNKTQNRDHYEKVIAAADVLTVSTPFLLDYHSQHRDNVVMIRNGVNINQFTRVTHTARKPILGWTGSTEYRNNDLEQLAEWLPDFLEDHDLYFHHAGAKRDSPSFADITGINPTRLRTSPMVPIDRYAEGFRFDIGLVPLNDIPFNHAKSNIKGLEMVAAGIPFVASDLPEYRLLHEDGVGLVATTAEQWAGQVTTLLDIAYRKREADRQWGIVNERWSIRSRAPEWKALFNNETHVPLEGA